MPANGKNMRVSRGWAMSITVLLCLSIALLVVVLLSLPVTRPGTLTTLFATVPVAQLIFFVGVFRLARRLTATPASSSTSSDAGASPFAFVDASVNLSETDDFERLGFANHLADLLDRMHGVAPSSVIALVGPWGIGKTSVLDTAVENLVSLNSNWQVARLNPWQYVSSEALMAGFFAELRNALPPEQRWSEAREALGGLLETASGFGSIASPLGFDLTSILGATARTLRRTTSATSAEARARRALNNMAQPILVIIDDVDRLEPIELARLFQMVRALGRLPYVHYLLAYDERTVLDSLVRSGLVGDSPRAVDFMEKIVQIRLDIPPLRPLQADHAINAHLETLMQEFDFRPDEIARDRFQTIFQEHLGRRLRTPRSILRWIEHVRLLYPRGVPAEVDFFDYVLVVWMRISLVNVTQMLLDNRGEIFASRSQKEHEQRNAAWRDRLEQAGVKKNEIESIYRFLGQLFPSIEDDRTTSPALTDLGPVRLRHGVGAPQYFERYFAHGVPDEDISEFEFAATMASVLREDLSDPRVDRLLARLEEDPTQTSERIEDFASSNADTPAPVIKLLLKVMQNTEETGLFSAHSAARGVAFRILRNSERRLALLSEISRTKSFQLPTLELVRSLTRNTGVSDREKGELREFGMSLIHQLLHAFPPQEHLRDWYPETWEIMWEWRAIDAKTLRAWYRSAVERDGDVIEGIAALAGRRRPLGVPGADWHLGGIETDAVEELLGLQWVRERLMRRIDDRAEPRVRIDGFFEVAEVTWKNRRGLALDWADQIMERASGDPSSL